MNKPDFEALRAKRNVEVMQVIQASAERLGWPKDKPIYHNFDFSACYCACPEGPCEHDFQGWRDLHDDKGNVSGGETFCKRCGMGAMSHSLRTGP